MSLALSGRISGASNISSSCWMSSMTRSTSMRPNHPVRSRDRSNRSGVSSRNRQILDLTRLRVRCGFSLPGGDSRQSGD
jgi:hypothetical protein